MKAIVKATEKIVDIIRYSAFDKDVFYDSNGQKYNREELSFDVKEKSFPKDDPDYWTKLEHQYAGMVMHSILQTMPGVSDPDKYMKAAIDLSAKIAHALVEKYKKEEK